MFFCVDLSITVGYYIRVKGEFILKKVISLLIVLSMVFSFSTVVFAVTDVITGDANSDGKVTAADARTTLRIAAFLVQPDENQKKAADVNGDDKITAADARKILRVAAGLGKFSNNGTGNGSSSSGLVNNPDGTVYIAVLSGSKYHRENCRTIKDSEIICVAVPDAVSHGYSACKVCDP